MIQSSAVERYLWIISDGSISKVTIGYPLHTTQAGLFGEAVGSVFALQEARFFPRQ